MNALYIFILMYIWEKLMNLVDYFVIKDMKFRGSHAEKGKWGS